MTLLLILLTARIFTEPSNRLQAPSVIGELFASVLLGWIKPTGAIRLMAGIGVILLPVHQNSVIDIRDCNNSLAADDVKTIQKQQNSACQHKCI